MYTQDTTISYDVKVPWLMIFLDSDGSVKIGKPLEWLNKLWLVQLAGGRGCYVEPGRLLWAE